MPTVPCVSVPSSEEVGLIIADAQLNISDGFSPTPDPDLDEVVLVPIVTGDAGAITSTNPDQPPGHLNAHPPARSSKPQMSLANITLHSPSTIVGTPFDISPRFEYPFPAASSMSDPEPQLPLHTSHMSSAYPISFMPSAPSLPLAALPRTRAEVRSHTPTHPKLQTRDPPVPPGLAKKRWTAGNAAVAVQKRLRSRSVVRQTEDAEGPAKAKVRTASEERPPDLKPSKDTIVAEESCEGKMQSPDKNLLPGVHEVLTPEVDPTHQGACVEALGDDVKMLSAVTP